MSNTWNLNGYQYDDTGYNYDSFEVAPFESEQGAYMSVCALANYSDGMTSGMGNVNAGSVQNVDLSSMNSHKACLGGLGSTLGSTMGRMGASLNARFKAEVEAGTLFGGQQIPADFDFAGYLKDLSYEKSGEILGTISNFGSTSENFGEDVYDPKTMLSTDWESLKTSDPSSYQTQMASLYELAKGKDCSEWTMDEKYAVISHYEDLEAKYADAKARSDEAASWGGYDDQAYTEMGQYKKEMKAIAADLKELGIMEYTATEKGWQNIKSATKALWNEGKDVFSALGQGDFKGAWQEAKEFGRQASATNAVITESAASGVAKIFEWGSDFSNIILTAAATPTTYVIDALAGTDITKNMWDATKDDVAMDKVGLAREWFYENTALGQTINENSQLKWDSEGSKLIQNVGTKVGEVAIATAVTVATGGTAAPFVAAGIGFLEGGGQEAERRFNLTDENGNYTNRGAKDILMATLHGVGKGAEWYGYGQLGQAAFQGIKTASALGKEGIAQIGKSITGEEAKAYLKANVGNLAKQAGVNMVKDVDTWVDIGTGVTNFIINGETTGQYNWGELALDTGLAIVGNYIGAFGGEYFEGALKHASQAAPDVAGLLPTGGSAETDTPKFDIFDPDGVGAKPSNLVDGLDDLSIKSNSEIPDDLFKVDSDVDLGDLKKGAEALSDEELEDVWGAGLFNRPKHAPKGYPGLPTAIKATDSPEFIKKTLLTADIDDCIKLSKTASPDQMREIATGVYLDRIKEFDARGISYIDYLDQCGIGCIAPATRMDAAVKMGDRNLWLQETIMKNSGKSFNFGPSGDFDFMNALNYGVKNGWVTPADLDFYNRNMVGVGALANQHYTPNQAAAVFNYTRCGGFEINGYLNDGTLHFSDGTTAKARSVYSSLDEIQDAVSGHQGNRVFPSSQGNIVSRLDSTIRHTNYDEAIVAYRGTGHVYNNGLQVDPSKLRVGDKLVTSDGFSSASIVPSSAYEKDYILQIIVPPKSGLGAYIEHMSGVNSYGQMEVLLKRGGGMVVAGDVFKSDFFGDGKLRTIIPVIMTD